MHVESDYSNVNDLLGHIISYKDNTTINWSVRGKPIPVWIYAVRATKINNPSITNLTRWYWENIFSTFSYTCCITWTSIIVFFKLWTFCFPMPLFLEISTSSLITSRFGSRLASSKTTRAKLLWSSSNKQSSCRVIMTTSIVLHMFMNQIRGFNLINIQTFTPISVSPKCL